MRPARAAFFSLVVLLLSPPVLAQEVELFSPYDLKQAMVDVLAGIEAVTGQAPKASQGMAGLSDEFYQDLYSSMTSREQFIVSAREATAMMDTAGTEWLKAFTPNYPGGYPWAWLMLFGLIDSKDDRCTGEGLEIYESALYGALQAVAIAEAACSVAGCDPTGIFVCLPVCGATEIVKLAVLTLKQPIDWCAAHGAGVDSAEIEAVYENSLLILDEADALAAALAAHDANIDGDLAAHDANIDGDLATHHANISSQLATHDADLKLQLATHDADIKALLANIQGTVDENQRLIKVFMSRQLEVLRLLITPNGQREINADVLTCTGDDCPVLSPTLICSNGSLRWNCK